MDIVAICHKKLHKFLVGIGDLPAVITLITIVSVEMSKMITGRISTEKIGRSIDHHVTEGNQCMIRHALAIIHRQILQFSGFVRPLDDDIKRKKVPDPIRRRIRNPVTCRIEMTNACGKATLQLSLGSNYFPGRGRFTQRCTKPNKLINKQSGSVHYPVIQADLPLISKTFALSFKAVPWLFIEIQFLKSETLSIDNDYHASTAKNRWRSSFCK